MTKIKYSIANVNNKMVHDTLNGDSLIKLVSGTSILQFVQLRDQHFTSLSKITKL